MCSASHSVKELHSAVGWVLAKVRGERDFLLVVRLLGFDAVWSGGNTPDIAQECTAAGFRAKLLIFLFVLKMAGADFYSTFVIIDQTARRQIPEDSNP